MNYKYTNTTKYLRRRYELTGTKLTVMVIAAGFLLWGMVSAGVFLGQVVSTVAQMPHTVCSDTTFSNCWQAK